MTDVPEKDTRSAFRESGEFIITSKAKLQVVFVPLKLFFVMNTSAMAVELEIMHTARCTLARSPPGTTVGGW